MDCWRLLFDLFLSVKENSIAAAHEKISECKKQILQAKRIRKNRQGKGQYLHWVVLLMCYLLRYVVPENRLRVFENAEENAVIVNGAYSAIWWVPHRLLKVWWLSR